MTHDDLKSFKISDQVKPTVTSQQARAPKSGTSAEAPPTASAGFPLIEALVESAQPDLSGLTARAAALDELQKAKGASNKQKASAKKAAAAYVKVRALVDYLLETKQKMAGGGPGTSGG